MKWELPEEAKRKQKERVRKAGVTTEDWKFSKEGKTLRFCLLQVCIQLCGEVSEERRCSASSYLQGEGLAVSLFMGTVQVQAVT